MERQDLSIYTWLLCKPSEKKQKKQKNREGGDAAVGLKMVVGLGRDGVETLNNDASAPAPH